MYNIGQSLGPKNKSNIYVKTALRTRLILQLLVKQERKKKQTTEMCFKKPEKAFFNVTTPAFAEVFPENRYSKKN